MHFNSDAIHDPCDPSPYPNNGTCEVVVGNASYICPPQLTGSTCEGNTFEDQT